ncbi:MAG: putative thiamine-phosphate pyrophosphorylase [Pseudolabrys sp.]|jgi:thiamine-phosphate pyrophosphorylase|nr:putative thiamine-phosphate pyrophosphorylase [Pseudolabrys sp.]
MAQRPKQAEPRPAPRLYLATPPVSDPAAIADALDAALGAADIAAVLLRLADGDERSQINIVKALAPVVQKHDTALLLDGHASLVARGGADGAHLRGIAAFSAALDTLKPERIAGAGGLPTRHDAMTAAEAGADYVMFGDGNSRDLAAVEERVAWWSELFEIPCVAFAATTGEIAPLVAAGADFIALDCVWQDARGMVPALAEIAPLLRLPEAVL